MSSGRIDAAGRAHPPAPPGARIVSLVPSITELLFDLGLGPQVAGRTTFCIHPRERVAAVPRVGGTKTPRLDRIRGLRPTHAVVNVDENRREDAAALADMGIRVIATHPCDPGDNPALYRLLGGVFGREAEAGALCRRFDAALARLRRAAAGAPRRRVLYLIWRDPWMTVSADTYIARTLAAAGLDVVGGGNAARYPELAPGAAMVADADVVLLSSEPYPFKPHHVDELRRLAGRADLPVRFIDGEMTSWYGSRAIAGCEYLARFARELAAA